MSNRPARLRKIHRTLAAVAVCVCLAALLFADHLRPNVPKKVHELLSKGEEELWDRSQIRESVVLIGDTGTAQPEILEPLEDHLRLGPADATTVVFLGDNVYSDGIPPDGHEDRERALRRIQRQLDVISRTGVRATFVPGNHDWASSGRAGDQYIRNEQREVEAVLGDIGFEPDEACPGPVRIASTPGFNIIAIDSQWFLHSYSRPELDGRSCPFSSQEALLIALQKDLRTDGGAPKKVAILAQHHPLISYGEHGTDDDCPNDLGCPRYQSFVKMMLAALDQVKPDICAAGHDHGLQLIQPEHGCQLHVVSGGGSHLGRVGVGPDTIFGAQRNGFMRIDILNDGSKVLTVFFINPSTKKWEQGYRRHLS